MPWSLQAYRTGRSRAISMSWTTSSIISTSPNRHYPLITICLSMSMGNGSSQRRDPLTLPPTHSLGSLNALKQSPMTRKPAIPVTGGKAQPGTVGGSGGLGNAYRSTTQRADRNGSTAHCRENERIKRLEQPG